MFKLLKINFLISFLIVFSIQINSEKYEPNWNSLDKRPLPKWFDEAKIGIFLHWGVFSTLPFSEWVWFNWKNKDPAITNYIKKYFPPNFDYSDLARDFKADLYDPDMLADLFKDSGAKYVVLTSKHHEGFTIWPSKFSWNWNSKDNGPKRDLVGELASSIRNKTDLRFGLYHSLYEWFNPLYLEDKKNNFTTNLFSTGKTQRELIELIEKYKPEVVWSDGEWEASDKYWNSTYFLSWLYNQSPVKNTVVVNDRWGQGVMCNHGDFYTCSDRYNPGILQKHKWENCMTLDLDSWGYRRVASLKDIISIENLIEQIASTISCGGNILVNAGIRSDGRIDPIMEERLRQMGAWLRTNQEAVYKSVPWRYQNDTITKNIWYTKNNNNIYAIILKWPEQNILKLSDPIVTKATDVWLLGYDKKLIFVAKQQGLDIVFPFISYNEIPSLYAWVLRITNVLNI